MDFRREVIFKFQLPLRLERVIVETILAGLDGTEGGLTYLSWEPTPRPPFRYHLRLASLRIFIKVQ
jgi:hypothetical protein